MSPSCVRVPLNYKPISANLIKIRSHLANEQRCTRLLLYLSSSQIKGIFHDRTTMKTWTDALYSSPQTSID